MPDVLIIGAGIVGCAVGEALGRQGASVGFVDPRGVGLGATQASAGMLTPYKEGLHNPVLEAPEEVTRIVRRAVRRQRAGAGLRA